MIAAIIQARMGSSRLPGKVLKPILGRPMIDLMIERVKWSKKLDKIIVATSQNQQDDEIADYCNENSILCFRGDETNVLKRYYEAAMKFNASTIVRLTSDCPLIDFNIIDKAIVLFEKNKYDFVSNTVPMPSTFPDGMDVEVFNFENLKKAYINAKLPSEKEHVTFHFWKTGLFNCYKFDYKYNYSDYRITVDYPEDFEVVKKVFENLYNIKNNFDIKDIVNFLKQNKKISMIQKKFKRNASWEKSFLEDKKFNKL